MLDTYGYDKCTCKGSVQNILLCQNVQNSVTLFEEILSKNVIEMFTYTC